MTFLLILKPCSVSLPLPALAPSPCSVGVELLPARVASDATIEVFLPSTAAAGPHPYVVTLCALSLQSFLKHTWHTCSRVQFSLLQPPRLCAKQMGLPSSVL
jgi:hypothetical protein